MNAAGGRERGTAGLLGLLALLYFAQGLPSGLLAKALPVLLREHGVSLSAIGFSGLLAVPWALKFLWAPFLDRFGTRRGWLLVLNAVTLLLMLVLAARDPAAWIGGALPLFLALLFFLNLVAATQDIATDGLAVSRLSERLRGVGNSVQVIGYKVGLLVGGGLLLVLVDRWGWMTAYGGVALLLVAVLVPVALMRDERTPAARAATHSPWHGVRGYGRLIAGFVARPGFGWLLVAVAVYKLGDSLASRMIGPLLRDHGFTLADIGWMTGVAGTVAGLAGALAGGVLLLRTGHRAAMLLFGVLQAAGLAAYIAVAQGYDDRAGLFAIVCFEQFADGLSTVALFTLMMDACRAHSPGTDYSLQASLQVTVAGVASLASGVVAEAAGYAAVFAAGALLTVAALLPVLRYFRAAGARPASHEAGTA